MTEPNAMSYLMCKYGCHKTVAVSGIFFSIFNLMVRLSVRCWKSCRSNILPGVYNFDSDVTPAAYTLKSEHQILCIVTCNSIIDGCRETRINGAAYTYSNSSRSAGYKIESSVLFNFCNPEPWRSGCFI